MTGGAIARAGPYLAAVAALLAFVLFGLSGVYTIRQQEKIDRELCLSAVENREAVRSTWDAARKLILPTADNPEMINRFFDGVLRPIPPLECIDNQPVPTEG